MGHKEGDDIEEYKGPLTPNVQVTSSDDVGSALLLACQYDHHARIVDLLAFRTRRCSLEGRSQSRLYASDLGKEDIVENLLYKGKKKPITNYKHSSTGRTPLIEAARNGQTGNVQMLLLAHSPADI